MRTARRPMTISGMDQQFSRAQFLTGTLIAAGAAVLGGCANLEGNTQASGTRTTAVTPTSTTPSTTAPPSAETYATLTPTTFDLHMDGITDTVPTTPGAHTIALTFDACGGPTGMGVDEALVDTLREFSVPATLFLNHRWIEENPDMTRTLHSDPLFRLENHGTLHAPLSVNGQSAYGIAGTSSPAEVIDEIEVNRELLRSFGADSTWFRSGTAHYDDVAVQIARDLGVSIAGFSVNGDDGAKASASQVAARIQDAPDGAIVLAHMNHPESGTAAGVRAALEEMSDARFVFVDGSVPDAR